MKKLGKILAIILLIAPMVFGVMFLSPNLAYNSTQTAQNGGGGANLLDSPKNAGNSDLDDPDLDKEEPQEYAITYKTYEDYFIDFQIPTKLLGKGTELSPYQINTTEDFLFLIKKSKI